MGDGNERNTQNLSKICTRKLSKFLSHVISIQYFWFDIFLDLKISNYIFPFDYTSLVFIFFEHIQ